jgi:hypothetical protein
MHHTPGINSTAAIPEFSCSVLMSSTVGNLRIVFPKTFTTLPHPRKKLSGKNSFFKGMG